MLLFCLKLTSEIPEGAGVDLNILLCQARDVLNYFTYNVHVKSKQIFVSGKELVCVLL